MSLECSTWWPAGWTVCRSPRIPTIDWAPSPRGATHTAEISYAFNNPKGQANQTWNDTDIRLADQMSSYWTLPWTLPLPLPEGTPSREGG